MAAKKDPYKIESQEPKAFEAAEKASRARKRAPAKRSSAKRSVKKK